MMKLNLKNVIKSDRNKNIVSITHKTLHNVRVQVLTFEDSIDAIYASAEIQRALKVGNELKNIEVADYEYSSFSIDLRERR